MKKGDAQLLSRRAMTTACGGFFAGMLAPPFLASAQAQQGALLARAIPHGGGEKLPVIGVGTSIVFNVGSGAADRAGPTSVVRALVAGGGTLVDTAPSYARSEGVVGDIVAETGLRSRVFLATKLERFRPGEEEAEARDCLKALKTTKVDVLQLHNVSDSRQDMGGLNALKAKGLCRYTGITTTYEGSYDAAEAIIRRSKPDFLEIDYAIDNREAEQRVLPAALDAGTAVIVALPFGRGRLFRAALGKKLPEWTSEFDCTSWAQFFLKFILSNPAINAAIPGTRNAEHMVDNLGAGRGRLPNASQRARMIQHVESLT